MEGNKSSRALDLIMNIKILEGNQGQCQLRKNTRNRIITVIGTSSFSCELYNFVCSSDIKLTRQICSTVTADPPRRGYRSLRHIDKVKLKNKKDEAMLSL
jgi:hypothetical protein